MSGHGRSRSRSPPLARSLAASSHGRHIWVGSAAEVDVAMRSITQHNKVAVDVEGQNLGHFGKVALIQVAVTKFGPTFLDDWEVVCYVFDIAELGMPLSLKQLLESETVIKVVHGFSNDQISLIEEFGVNFKNSTLWDTSVAAGMLGSDQARTSLVDVLQKYSDAGVEVLAALSDLKKDIPVQPNFFERPLPERLLQYVCLDVQHLEDVHDQMCMKMSFDQMRDVTEQSIYMGKWSNNFHGGTSAAADAHRAWAEQRAATAMASDKHCFVASRGGRGTMKCEKCKDYNVGVKEGSCRVCGHRNSVFDV